MSEQDDVSRRAREMVKILRSPCNVYGRDKNGRLRLADKYDGRRVMWIPLKKSNDVIRCYDGKRKILEDIPISNPKEVDSIIRIMIALIEGLFSGAI